MYFTIFKNHVLIYQIFIYRSGFTGSEPIWSCCVPACCRLFIYPALRRCSSVNAGWSRSQRLACQPPPQCLLSHAVKAHRHPLGLFAPGASSGHVTGCYMRAPHVRTEGRRAATDWSDRAGGGRRAAGGASGTDRVDRQS